MLAHDESVAPPKTFAVELTLTTDDQTPGQVRLRIALHGKEPVDIAIPARPDQIEWFDPDAKTLLAPTPHVMWSAWRMDNDGLALDSRPSTAQRASKYVTLYPGNAQEVTVDLGAALDGLYGAGTLAQGWCARAWLVGGVHPVSSNVICWPHS
jgi:hypothetical protein